jgi:N-acetylglucosamine kinase-like BadF-type ATPase
VRTVLAVDGGNSKTDLALVTEDGRLLAAVRGGTTSHQAIDFDVGMARLTTLVDEVKAIAGRSGPADVAVYGLAGADTPSDQRTLTAALSARGFADGLLLRNDTFTALRAGTDRGWGVVVICGAGVNAAGVAPNGKSARLAALGSISGDWGGGTDVGWAGLAAAVRARDARGPATRLATDVPAHFGLHRPSAVTAAMYAGRIPERRVRELSPVVFAAARDGDAAAREIVDRLADEIVAMAGAMLRRLHLTRRDPEVVLAGGVFRTDYGVFRARIVEGVTAVAPRARLVREAAPPVAGAALIGLDQFRGRAREPGPVDRAVRTALADWDRVMTMSAAEGVALRPSPT